MAILFFWNLERCQTMANLFHSTILIMFTLWRLPVFLMGVSAGLLAVREVEDPHHHRPLLHDVFPWSLSASTSLRPASSSSEASWAGGRTGTLSSCSASSCITLSGTASRRWSGVNFFFTLWLSAKCPYKLNFWGGWVVYWVFISYFEVFPYTEKYRKYQAKDFFIFY